MVIQNTYLNLSNIVHTDFELGRVIQTVVPADPGITGTNHLVFSRPSVTKSSEHSLCKRYELTCPSECHGRCWTPDMVPLRAVAL